MRAAWLIAAAVLLFCVGPVQAQPAPSWPHSVTGPNGASVTVYQPQAISWPEHKTLATRAAIAITPKGAKTPTYVPVLTRVRGEQQMGAIPLTKSVFKKVVQERAAVLAADAPSEVGSASILGAQIRSTLGVPLWKGAEILGILQVDNRSSNAAAIFTTADLDLLSLLATNASLAIAKLVGRKGQQLSTMKAIVPSILCGFSSTSDAPFQLATSGPWPAMRLWSERPPGAKPSALAS